MQFSITNWIIYRSRLALAGKKVDKSYATYMSKYHAVADTRLTDRMLNSLMECHERELLSMEPYDVALTPCLGALVARGLLGVRKYRSPMGKEFHGVFITDKGRDILNTL